MKFDKEISRNAWGVITNRWQGEEKRVLCVCSAGCLRSPTAANVLHKEYGYNTRCAGVSLEYAIIPVTARLLAWASEILVMESWQAHVIEAMLLDMNVDVKPEIICLNIPDDYSYMQPELVELIKERYNEHCQKWLNELEIEDEV